MADFWYAKNVEKLNRSSYCHKIWQEASSYSCDELCRKIGILGLKMADLRPFLYLEKCQNLNQLIFFRPVFAKMFPMIILSNIFENERFRIKNGRNMPFFEKIAFWGVPRGFIKE